MPAAYSVLSAGLYAIKFAEVLYRKKGAQTWSQFGDVDSFTLNITPNILTRYRKNNSVRTKAIEVPNQVDSTISFVCYQFTDFVRAVSVLGEAQPMTQTAAVAQPYKIESYGPGLHWMQMYDISNVTFPEGFVEGTHYKVVDPALGMIEIFDVAPPEGVELGSEVDITFDAAEITAADKRVSAKVASKTEIEVELLVRQVGAVGKKEALHLFDCRLKPEGDLNLIGGDDFSNVTISGSALDTSNGVGILVDLAD